MGTFHVQRGRGLPLMKTMSVRDRSSRRWAMITAAFLGLAIASGLVGAMTHPPGDVGARPFTAPLSYISVQ